MKAVDAMSAAPPAGHRTGANRWERGTLWLQHVDPPPAVEGPWPPLASDPDAFTTFARDLGADERYRFIDVLDVDAPPKRALAFVVCYPTGGSVAEAILPLFSTDPPPNAAFFARQTVGGVDRRPSSSSMRAWRGGDVVGSGPLVRRRRGVQEMLTQARAARWRCSTLS